MASGGAETTRLRSSWAFGIQEAVDDSAAQHNAQVARPINAPGESGAGRRAILNAVAERQGGHTPNELERPHEGKSEVKLKVP